MPNTLSKCLSFLLISGALFPIKVFTALVGVAQVVGGHPLHKKVVGSITSQGMCPSYRLCFQ